MVKLAAVIRGSSRAVSEAASFSGLFTVTFVVGATSQVAFSLLGLLMAATSPGMFKMNNAAATSPAQAVGVLVFLLAVLLVINARHVCGDQPGSWVLVRQALPGMKVGPGRGYRGFPGPPPRPSASASESATEIVDSRSATAVSAAIIAPHGVGSSRRPGSPLDALEGHAEWAQFVQDDVPG